MPEFAAQSGGIGDFRAVYRSHYGFVWHTLQRLGTAQGAIEDALQEVFVVAFRRRATFQGPSAKAWLYGIARRVASNHRRWQRRQTKRLRVARTLDTHTEGGREAIETLNRYLAGLTEEDRELFVLWEVDGMTGPEIASARGRNVQTIYTRVRKLRREFRASLDLDDVRRSRPRASARSWAALAPLLGKAPVVVAGGWTAAFASNWLGAALGASVAMGGLVVADGMLPPTADDVAMAEARRLGDGRVDRAASESRPANDVAAAAAAVAVAAPIASSPAEWRRNPGAPQIDRRAPQRASASPPVAPPVATSLGQETALLRQASEAVRKGAMGRALELTEMHERTFARSRLSDLRTALRIEALCGLHRTAQARGEATLFLAEHPTSSVARRVEKSCSLPPQKTPRSDNPGT